jgi:hypothetical protein
MYQSCTPSMEPVHAGLYDPAVLEPPQGPDDARALLRRLRMIAQQQPQSKPVCQELIRKQENALREMPSARRRRPTRRPDG